MDKRKGSALHQFEKLVDHWKRLLQLVDSGLINSEHAIIAVAAATKLLFKSGAYLDEEGNWAHPRLRK